MSPRILFPAVFLILLDIQVTGSRAQTPTDTAITTEVLFASGVVKDLDMLTALLAGACGNGSRSAFSDRLREGFMEWELRTDTRRGLYALAFSMRSKKGSLPFLFQARDSGPIHLAISRLAAQRESAPVIFRAGRHPAKERLLERLEQHHARIRQSIRSLRAQYARSLPVTPGARIAGTPPGIADVSLLGVGAMASPK